MCSKTNHQRILNDNHCPSFKPRPCSEKLQISASQHPHHLQQRPPSTRPLPCSFSRPQRVEICYDLRSLLHLPSRVGRHRAPWTTAAVRTPATDRLLTSPAIQAAPLLAATILSATSNLGQITDDQTTKQVASSDQLGRTMVVLDDHFESLSPVFLSADAVVGRT